MVGDEFHVRPGAVVVALLSKGATVVQYRDADKSRVTVAVGRNRDAKIPAARVVLVTDYVPAGREELEKFRRTSEKMAADVDLSEVWELVRDEEDDTTADALAELYWGDSAEAAQRVAVALHLDRHTDYFVRKPDGYAARTVEALYEIRARRRREAEYASDAAALMEALRERRLPDPPTKNQEAQLHHLREYAVHGDDYARGHAARDLLERAVIGSGDVQRACFELLASAGVFSPDEPLELARADIPLAHPVDSLAEADAVAREPTRPAEAADLTGLGVFTIDNAGTEERDDALSFDTAGGPTFRIGVHIAYAGLLVPRGGAMDREADRRMATLYLPERRIDMLPPAFCLGVGSLDPAEDRFALSLSVELSETGETVSWDLKPSLVRSTAALSYEDADRVLGDEADSTHPAIAGLERAARALRARREESGAVTLDQPEMSISVDEQGRVRVTVTRRDSPARQLVAEMAILYNVLAAELCRSEGIPAVYRVQSAPDLSDIADFPEPLRRYQAARRLFPADLDSEPGPHGGLGVPAYLQATSPLRRYPDLVMQRQAAHYLATGKHLYTPEEIASVMQRAEVQLRELSRIEDARRRYWFLRFLQSSVLDAPDSSGVSREFEAVVLENEPHRRALLELHEYPFRMRAEVPRHVEPGDRVALELQEVDLWRRLALFVYAQRGA